MEMPPVGAVSVPRLCLCSDARTLLGNFNDPSRAAATDHAGDLASSSLSDLSPPFHWSLPWPGMLMGTDIRTAWPGSQDREPVTGDRVAELTKGFVEGKRKEKKR